MSSESRFNQKEVEAAIVEQRQLEALAQRLEAQADALDGDGPSSDAGPR